MKFDILCNIILEAKKTDRFAKMTIGNATPVFTIEDVLKDANDPSKGLVTYLSHRDAEGKEQVDPERLARRALRRINWVAKAAIKRLGGREIGLEKLNRFIIDLLERYQTKVLGFEKPDKARTGYEARIIGNLLLPPTNRHPNAKGVFVPVDVTPVAKAPGQRKAKVDAEQISADFNRTADEHVAGFDEDLYDTIKSIIEAMEAATTTDILRNPQIKGVYDPKTVKLAIKRMVEDGTIAQDNEDMLVLTYNEVEGVVAAKSPVEGDEIEDEAESEPGVSKAQDDLEDEEPDPFEREDTESEGSARRLGYIPDNKSGKWY